MAHSRIRNFDKILERLKASLNPIGEMIEVDTVSAGSRTHPLVKIVLGEGNPRRVLISAGIHGDEPAGVETLCVFLENHLYKNFQKDWEFTLLPCINPHGFEAGSRNNQDDIDLNWQFKESHPPREVVFVQSALSQAYHLDLELHEDVDSPGYYLYQKDKSAPLSSLGRVILDHVADIHPLNLASNIEELPAEQGLVSRLNDPETMERWPMALYANQQGCNHVFTMETSPSLPMDTRIKTHLKAIKTALETMPEQEKI